jgi:uncharacterized membrane protein
MPQGKRKRMIKVYQPTSQSPEVMYSRWHQLNKAGLHTPSIRLQAREYGANRVRVK